jgi:protein involved in sex pheromone biosynthesis
MMEAVSTSEKSVNFYQTTRRKIPEGSHHHIRYRENLKSYFKNPHISVQGCAKWRENEKPNQLFFLDLPS